MTIRAKLYLSVATLIVVFVVTLAVVAITVVQNTHRTQAYSRLREQSRFTSDIQTDIYLHLAAFSDSISLPTSHEMVKWPAYALTDLTSQIRRATDPQERQHWQAIHDAIDHIITADGQLQTKTEVDRVMEVARINLRALRMHYDLAEAESIAAVAATGLRAQIAIAGAFTLMVFLFAIYIMLVRDWLVRPIEVLKASADVIGDGALDHRVPLKGNDELSQLARRLDAMAAALATRQAELITARELAAIGALSANIAHGLRNPLAAIRACAQLAERRAETEAAKSLIADMILQADRMDARITKMFALSRPSALRHDCASFAELAQSAHAHARPLADAHNLRVIIDDQTQDTVWCVDREQIAEALGELVTNAAHHTPAGGEIVLRGAVVQAKHGSPSHLEVQVVDHGEGMSPATAKKACDLFFTGRPNGTGVGLALASRAMETHGGSLTIESARGEGTTIRVILPCACPNPNYPDTSRCFVRLQDQERARAL